MVWLSKKPYIASLADTLASFQNLLHSYNILHSFSKEFSSSFHPPFHQNDVSIKVCGISFGHLGGGNNGATDFGKYNHVEAGVMPVCI